MLRELCKETLLQGGDISPVVIPAGHTGGTTLMNPSVFVWDGRIIVNVRHVNYVLYHCEGDELFYHRWGPLVYIHPENDVTLTTKNYIAFFHDNLEMTGFAKVETDKLDTKPMWDFIGLEDGRLVKWDGKLFLSGVRRDVKIGGEGRMELSELITKDCRMFEVTRMRIEVPEGETSYCEKNWMPVLDMPYHYVKWCNPTQLVKVDPFTGKSKEVYKCKYTIPGLPDFRGGSQVIPWKGYHIAMIHQSYLFNNQIGQKDGDYSHRLLVWDKDWDLIHVGEPFKFMTGSIEFCCGMDFFKGDLLVSFGFQDNASYLLRIPEDKVESLFNLKYLDFKWGIFKKDPEFFYNVKQELFERDIYQMIFPVEEGDVVVDIGASCGPFTRMALDKNPKHIYSMEPNKELSVTMEENFADNKIVTVINKGIASNDGPFIFENVYEPLTNHKFWEKANGEGISLKTFIKEYGIKNIDFLKIDCEGGEYDFFNDENLEWILKHVKKISAEIHLLDEPMMFKYSRFRDIYLSKFQEYEAYTYDGSQNLTKDILTDEFAKTPRYFMLYIDNR